MMNRERRCWERFYLDINEMGHCLVVDEHGNGFEARVINVGVGGLCFELVDSAVGPKTLPPPEFGVGDLFSFTCNCENKWGRHIQGRSGRVAWASGALYGLCFEKPLGTEEAPSCPLDQGQRIELSPLDRLKGQLWGGGSATRQLLRRLSSEMADLLGKSPKDDT